MPRPGRISISRRSTCVISHGFIERWCRSIGSPFTARALSSWSGRWRMSEAVAVPLSAAQRISSIRRQLLALDEQAARDTFSVPSGDRLLKSTVSLCPDCLEHVPAAVHAGGGRVLMSKRCEAHGRSVALMESDERFYFLSNKDNSGRRYAEDRVLPIREFAGGGCCGANGGGCSAQTEAAFAPWTDQLRNKSCTVLVEITDACNLACPVCYSDAKGERKLPLAKFQQYILDLIEQKGGLDSVQLTGGEAMLHPEFWHFVDFLHRQPLLKKIYLPTNGLLLANAATADRLLPFRDKLMVLLQFDGMTADANRTMRGVN